MMEILKRFGAQLSKAKVVEDDYVSKNDPEMNKQEALRKEKAKEYSEAFAEHISHLISKEQFQYLSQHHNYADIRFGARRVALSLIHI